MGKFSQRLVLGSVLFVAALPPAGAEPDRAALDAAHRASMAAAVARVKEGFHIRGEPWTGEIKPGGRKVIRHQLFRGNEYWFWLGTPNAAAGLSVKIYDREGRPVHLESVGGERSAAARVLPPETGSYLIVVTAAKGEGEAAPWSMSYGYR